MFRYHIKPILTVFFIFSLAGQEIIYSDKNKIQITPIITRLANPWSMTWLPGSQQGLITERNGGLIYFDLDTKERIPLTIPAQIYQSGQGGLLDLALDPDYSKNGWIYLSFSLDLGSKNTTALARFKLINRKIESFKVLFTAQPASRAGYHFGSRLVFPESFGGPRGDLFMSIGERNLREPAQDLNNQIGKVLHFNYLKNFIPDIYSYGHRNPQGLVWDSLSGRLLEHEHGAKGGDEINIIVKKKNYGWPIISYGRNYDGSKIGKGNSSLGMEQPMYYWDPSIAPSGFAVYRGREFPEWEGNLLVGSLKFGLLVRLELNASRDKVLKEERLLNNRLGRIRYVGVGKVGEVYLLTDSSNGVLYRLTKSSQ